MADHDWTKMMMINIGLDACSLGLFMERPSVNDNDNDDDDDVSDDDDVDDDDSSESNGCS